MKCKKSIVLLALAVTLALVPVVLTQAKKPLYCEKWMDMYLDEPICRGPISGDIDGWFVIYPLDPPYEETTGQVTHYRSRWEIYTDDTMTTMFMSGTLKVVDIIRKLEWQGQGVVEWVDDEFEAGRYADYLGSKWHAKGIYAPGPEPPLYTRVIDTIFRMN